MIPRPSIDWIRNSSLPAFELAIARRTACEGKVHVKIRRNANSIRASDGKCGGASRGALRQGQMTGKEERSKERCIRCGRCAASADVMTKLLLGGPTSVGGTASCPLPSRHPLVELLCAVIVLTFAIPFPTSPFRASAWSGSRSLSRGK